MCFAREHRIAFKFGVHFLRNKFFQKNKNQYVFNSIRLLFVVTLSDGGFFFYTQCQLFVNIFFFCQFIHKKKNNGMYLIPLSNVKRVKLLNESRLFFQHRLIVIEEQKPFVVSVIRSSFYVLKISKNLFVNII